MNERERALLALRRGTDADDGDSSPESDFVRTIVNGVLRWRGLLDHFVAALASRPTSHIDPAALDITRIGLYQIRYMNVPDHAAVSETVELAARHAPRAKGFVNAILRNGLRRGLDSLVPAGEDLESASIRLSHPRWLLERWTRRFGRDRALAIAAANQELSHGDLLVNTSRLSVDQMLERLAGRGVVASASPLVTAMIRLASSSREVAGEVESGLAYGMDEGSALVALSALGNAPILDLAAAPGSKSIFLRNCGAKVVSHDVSLERMLPLRNAMRRMFGGGGTLVVGDGIRPAFARRFAGVLVDAPCSGTGIIRRHPAIRWRLQPDRIARLASRQRGLLGAALDLADDYCVWATCSLEPEENDDIVQATIAERRDFVLDDLGRFLPESAVPWIDRGMLRLSPESGADGFTAIRMRRTRKTA